MPSLPRILALAAVVTVATALTPSAGAGCGFVTAKSFGNYPPTTYCPGPPDAYGICGVISPVLDLSLLESAWWRLGSGDPDVGEGIDNGAHVAYPPVPPFQGWLYPNSYPYPYPGLSDWLIAGNTDTGPTDGCPATDSPPDYLIVRFSDPEGNLVVAAASYVANRRNQFDFAVTGTHIFLQPIPAPTITSSNHVGTVTTVGISGPTLASLQPCFHDETGGLVTAADVFTGYRVYAKIVNRGDPAPTERRIVAGGWTPIGGVIGLGAPTSVVLECATDSDAYLGVAIVFEGSDPFDSAAVSAAPRLLQCGPTLAEPREPRKLLDRPRPDRGKPRRER